MCIMLLKYNLAMGRWNDVHHGCMVCINNIAAITVGGIEMKHFDDGGDPVIR